MALIKKFEDSVAWQEARKLNRMIYNITQSGALSKDFGLRDQIQRASVSVMTNIAEGFDCESNLEFARFLVISRRSSVEVQSLLYTALDVGYIDEQTVKTHYQYITKRPGEARKQGAGVRPHPVFGNSFNFREVLTMNKPIKPKALLTL